MNKLEYKEITAFHPGYYIADIIEDMGVSRAEFAARMGITEQNLNLSKLLDGQADLSHDLAQKLAAMLGTGVEVWVNLQSEYNRKKTEIDRLVLKQAEQRRNIKELFADFHGEYAPIEIDWGSSVGEEIW